MYPSVPFALRPVACCVLAACCELAAANPTGASVAAGAATFQSAAKTLTVTNTPGTVINWQGFSIPGGETTRFVQQSPASAVLNRVVGPDPSSLLGTLSSNGRVFLINTNGIVVGAGARIDTAGFIASTLNITDTDFQQGRLRFEGGGAGALRNAGTIQASGDIMLVGPQIENTGIIRSENGAVLLAAGRKLTITSPDAQGVRFELQAATDSALNVGTLDARTAATMFAGTLRHSGDIRVGAASVDESGRVTLIAQKDAIVDKTATITANGARGGEVTIRAGELTWVEGAIEAKGSAGPGGTVHLLGERVGLSGATVDVSGETGGGTILVGGDYQGRSGDLPNAKMTYVSADATLKADSIAAGDGGRVIVWADGVTRFDGAISARGGAASGNGGLVETSGLGGLAIAQGRVDTRAAAGHAGTWLLDPQTINVEAVGASLPPGNTVPFGDQIGMPMNIAAGAIAGAASNVTLQANTDINFNAPISMVESGVAITAQAGRSISVNQNITTLNGNVTLIANETVANGVINGDRLAGAANITMAPGTAINAGNANVALTIAPGVGHAATSGEITVASITAGNVAVQHNGPTANGRIVRAASGATMLTGSTSVFLQTTTAGGFGIGTLAEPIRVTTPALEAHTTSSAGGIFIEGSGDLGIGGVPLSIFGGTVRGVQALAGGAVSITTTGNLTHAPGGVSTMCGPGANFGSNPICAVGAGNSVTLNAATIGSAGGGRLHVQTSGAGVTATATSGGVFLQQVNGTLNVSNYSLSVPTGQAIELANLNGAISVDASMSFATRPVTLVTGSADTNFGAVTVDASTLTLSGGGAARFDAGAAAINAAVTIDKPVGIAGGTASFNNGGSLNGGVTLASGGLAVNGVNPATINGGTLAWSGGTISGTGSLALAGGAIVDVAGGGARVLNGPSLTIANMSLGGGSLDVQGGTLTLTGTVTKVPSATLQLSASGQIDAVGGALPGLVMSGGTLARSVGGDLTIAGDFTVTGGAIPSGGGELVTQGNTTIGGVMFPQRNWRNAGILDIASGGRMSPSPGGGFQFTNAAGGTVNLSTNLVAPFGAANEAVVTNQGTLNVAAPGPDAMVVPNAFTQVGGANLNITGGTLDLQDARTLAGNMSIPAGRTLLISSGAGAVFDGTTISGTGTIQVRGVDGATPQAAFRNVSAGGNALSVGANGTVVFDTSPSTLGSVSVGAIVMPGDAAGALTANTALTINGGLNVAGIATFNDTTAVVGGVSVTDTLGGTGAFTAPSLNWIGGAIQGSGLKTFTTVTSSDSASTPHLAGAVALADSGTWNHSGVMSQDGAGQLAIGTGAVVTNQNLASWNLTSSVGNAISGTGRFDNAGTFSNAGATPHSITAPFFNTGTVNVAGSSALVLGPGGASPDTGLISLAGTSSITFNGDRTLGPLSLVSASGGTFAVSGGTLNVNGAINTDGPMSFLGGTANFSPGLLLSPTTMTVNGGTADFLRLVTIDSTLAISSGRVNFREPATVGATLSLSGGTLGGTGPVGVTGLTTWSGGAMDGSGTTAVNGGLAISGNATKSLLLERRLDIPVGRTATWSVGTIVVGGDARINNSGTWSDQTPGASMLGSGIANFNNTGAYNKTAAGVTTMGVAFNNSGVGSVNVSNGGLNLQGGGASSRPFNVTGSLQFASDYAVNAGSDIAGTGSVAFTGGTTTLTGGTYNVGATSASGGTANFNSGVNVAGIGAITVTAGEIALNTGAVAPITAPSLNLLGGVISGSDSLAISGPATWTAGTMRGTGTTAVNGGLAIGGAGAKVLDRRALNNTGTATWDGLAGSLDRIQTGNGASINNSGTWNDRTGNGAHIANDLGGTMSTFNNTGVYVKSARTGSTAIESMSIDIPYNVSGGGSTSVQSGVLRLTGGGASSRPFGIASNATLEFGGGTYDLNAGSNFTAVQGRVLVTAGTANFNGGTYDVAGGTTVTGGIANFTAGETVVNTGPLNVQGGTLNLSSGEAITAPALTLSGGTLTGTDRIDVSGATNWSGGVMTGAGITNANGGLVISGVSNKDLDGGRTLNNTGTATWTNAATSGQGRIRTGAGATINNSGTWQDQTVGGTIDHGLGGAGSVFNNTGTYIKSGAGTTRVDTAVALNNTGSGQLQVQDGTLQLRGGGVSTALVSVSATAALDLNAGNYGFNSGTAVNGTGTLRVSGATLDVNTPLMLAGTLDVSGGTLNAPSAVTLDNTFVWSGGTITGDGVLTTSAGSSSNVSGAVTLTDKVWNNFGNATLSGASRITLAGTGAKPVALNNRSGATLADDSSDAAPIAFATTAANKRFDNAGTFDKGVVSAAVQTIDVPATNTGTFNANAGTLTLPRFAANDGTINIASTATVSTGGNALANNGTIGGAGTLNLGAANSLTNSGTLRPGAAVGDTTDTLTITGNLVQEASGRIDLEFGGTAARAFDALAVSGTATLGGTVNVSTVGGYTPAIGDAFPVIGAGTRVGNFSTVNKTFATNMTAAYGATSLTFTIGGGPVNSWISGSGDWSVGGNWSLGHVPTTIETALLDQPGALTITVPVGTFTTSAVTSNENLAINGGTLSLANASTINASLGISGGTLQSAGPLSVNGPLTLAGGTLAGAGAVTVSGATTVSGASQISGPLSVASFSMGSGSLAVNAGGTLNLPAAAAKSIDNARLSNSGTLNIAGGDVTLSNAALLENAGVLNLEGSSRIALGGAGATALTNLSGGVINDRSSSSTPVTGTAGTRFTNAGTLNKTTTAAATQSLDIAFDNSRQVNVDAGTLVLTQGGADSGTYNVPSGTLLNLSAGSRDFNAGVALTGGGTLRVSGATLNVNTPLTQASTSPALDLQAGTVNNVAGLALNGGFTWSGGTVTGAGTLTTGTSATTTIDGVATLSDTRWTNFGPVALSGDGRIVLSGTGTTLTTFDNRSGGVITDTSAAATPIGFAATRASTRFDNSGRFVKAAGSAATQTLDVPMTNTRAIAPLSGDGIAVESGTLVANGLPSNAGVIDLSSGATFSTAGAPLSNAPAGVVRGNGTLDVGASAFTNHGLVSPGASPGVLTIAGNYAQAADGVLAIEIQGPQQGVDYDLLKVTGNAALDGALTLLVPHPISSGSNFQVITYASRTGDFAVKTSPPGLVFDATPGATSYDVTRTTEPGANSTLPAQFLNTRDVYGDRFLPRDPPRGDRDPRDPRDPREERRRVLPDCR